MTDYQIAQQIYDVLWNFDYIDFQIQIESTDIKITPMDKTEDEDGTKWINFQAYYEDEAFYYEPTLRLRLGSWNRNFLSDGESYYIVAYVNNNYHHEVSMKRILDMGSLENKIPFFTSVGYSLRDSTENNEQRRTFTLNLLKQMNLATDERSVCLGVWLVEKQDFVEGVTSFVRSLFCTSILKAHYRKGEDIQLIGLPEIRSQDFYDEGENDGMNVWKIAPGRNASLWDAALEEGSIFIGWPQMGNLSHYETREELIEKYQQVFNTDRNPVNDSFTLWAFCHEMKPGDFVIADGEAHSRLTSEKGPDCLPPE